MPGCPGFYVLQVTWSREVRKEESCLVWRRTVNISP